MFNPVVSNNAMGIVGDKSVTESGVFLSVAEPSIIVSMFYDRYKCSLGL